MEGFYLLCGHLLGDYILQNDWMAQNKTNPHPGPTPDLPWGMEHQSGPAWADGNAKHSAWRTGNLACLAHCLLYTLAVWLCSFWWMPAWGLAVCLGVHYAIDRYRLARKWMGLVGQEQFATGPLSPWSIIVVDNTIHLLTLAAIAAACGR